MFKVIVGVNGCWQTTITFYSNRKSGSRLGNCHSAVLGITPIQTLESAQSDDIVSQGKPQIKYSADGKRIEGFYLAGKSYILTESTGISWEYT